MFSQRNSPILVLTIPLVLFTACAPTTKDGMTSIPDQTQEMRDEGEIVSDAAVDTKQIVMTKWDLWASGETLLRGANLYQRLMYPEWDGPDWFGPGPLGPPVTQDDFNRMAELGANYVNLSHPGLFTEEPPFELNEGSQANLDGLLEMVAQADMFAVISFRTGPGRSEFSFLGVAEDDEWGQSMLNDSVWEDQAAQDAWVEMWRTTAERYRDNPVVVGYDLMVEPNGNAIFFDIYWPPDFYPAYADTLYDWNQLYPRIVEAIREVDPHTPILAGAIGWSAVDWLPYLEPTDDPRTVYTVHQYTPMDYTHQGPDASGDLPNTYPGELDINGDGEVETFDRAWLKDWLGKVDDFMARTGMPVAVNEFGVYRFEPGAAEYMDDLMGLFEARGANYALWAWTSDWMLAHEQVEEMEFRLGTDIDNRTVDVPSNLQDVILSYWALNTLRPSGVHFEP
jgi:hypothetical protein